MPRFPVAFGRRKSTADQLENAVAEHSFRVLERHEVAGGKSFDGGARLSAKTHHMPKTSLTDINVEENIFAGLKNNRGSGSSNTTKTTSTDNSSRHSNASTAPSSTVELNGQEEAKNGNKKPFADIPIPPIPKAHSSGFLKAAGRTFSFGAQKKHHPPAEILAEESLPTSPTYSDHNQTPQKVGGRPRATTATTSSTSTTVTPPKVEDFDLDLGGDFSKMMLGYDKRSSTISVANESERVALGPRSLTGNRVNQPAPLQINKSAKIEVSPYSWSSQHSNDQLLTTSPLLPASNNENVPPPVPRHGSPFGGRAQPNPPSPEASVKSPMLNHESNIEVGDVEDEDARLLKDNFSAMNRFLAANNPDSGSVSSSRYRRNEDTFNARQAPWEGKPSRFDSRGDDDNLFEGSLTHSARVANHYVSQRPSPPQNKVMTPAQFEQYRQDKERQDRESQDDASSTVKLDEDGDEDNYEDDEDEIEKARQQAKQRRKQEAKMSVYRQQMMKVTGESASLPSSRPSLSISLSTPNLPGIAPSPSPGATTSDNSEEDEEVPLAILAAHGFPSRNRPPTRLHNMMSNPNLRAAQQPSYQRPGSVAGPAGGAGSRLPAFAKNLPQDPFVGASLVNNPVRESFALGGGSPSPGGPLPPGGLVGVIASEERNRAARRGSPQIDNQNLRPPPGDPTFDPVNGIPAHMMYPGRSSPMLLTPGEQAQIQMTQQMQQFMQMQMQFMHLVAGQQTGNMAVTPSAQMPIPGQPTGNFNGMGGMPSMGTMPAMPMATPDMMRHSFVGNESMLDLPRGDNHLRTMSMVQPSSASWIQPPQNPGYAPSVHAQGNYAPSIAPSERSNIGLPGRYRPVSQMLAPHQSHLRNSSAMSGAPGTSPDKQPKVSVNKSENVSDDDDEEGWAAMKAKREKKKSLWKSKKGFGAEISALIS